MRFKITGAAALQLCAIGLSASAFAEAPQQASAVREEIIVTTAADQPKAQTVTSIDKSIFENSPAFSIGQVLQYSPGVTIKQGNGPRDVGISIRGSNARNGFGVRNIQVFEDGFPVTQPDGLSRTDLTDPHAYGGIDVYRGPSSALFGNYATGGAVNFHTRRGGEINGVELGLDGGKFGYLNGYIAAGNKIDGFEYAAFVSHVRGDGYISTSDYDTTTVNLLASYQATDNDTFTVKFINNDLNAHLPIRQSLNQYRLNPFQQGCAVAASAAVGCGAVNLFANGFSGATAAQSSAEAGLGRDDRRTVVGGRWEHTFDGGAVWRTQLVYDVKDIKQPTGATSAVGATPSFNAMSDITATGSLFGLEATHFAGLFFNTVDINSYTYNVMPGGNATIGGLTATTFGKLSNYGGRLREQLRLSAAWSVIAGTGLEYSDLSARNTAYRYTGTTPATTVLDAARHFLNVAPEVALYFTPDDVWQTRARVSTGYGIPQAGNLFVTPAGVSGSNLTLKSQSNIGADLGVDWTPSQTVKLSVTGFYEFFKNEFVTQSPGAGLLSYTFNAPKSEHRGIEVAAQWRPLDGLAATLSYTFNDQIYTVYAEQLSAGTRTATFDRAGNAIPGVEPHNVSARLAYDQPVGPWQGFGGFIEMNFRDHFYIDNANSVRAPDYTLFNLNLHYGHDLAGGTIKGFRLFVEVQNLMGRTYVASANSVSNSLNATTGAQNPVATVLAATGSVYAGAPRNVIGGLKLKF